MNVPGPRGLHALVALLGLRRDPLRTFAGAAARYGPIVRFPLGARTFLLLHRPEHLRQVLLDRRGIYSKRTASYDRLRDVIGEGILTADGERWRRLRAPTHACIHAARHSTLIAATRELTHELCERWRLRARSGQLVDLGRDMVWLTLSVLARSLFSSDARKSAACVGDALCDVLAVVQRRIESLWPWPSALPTPANRRFRRGLARLDAEISRLLADGGQSYEALCPAHGSATGFRELRDQLLTLYLAGHETTANVLTWALWLSARHPSVSQRLREDSGHGRLSFARAVVDETLRLYPPVWLVERRAEACDVIDAREIPRGSTLALCIYLAHRDPELWPRPNDFRPGRFSDARAASARGALIPFGAGPRACPGAEFAMAEMSLALATLAGCFEIEIASAEPRPAPGITLRPNRPVLARVRSLRGSPCCPAGVDEGDPAPV